MKLRKSFKKGFTLVELVVVIAIIAILAGVGVAVYIGITNKAKVTADSEIITQLNLKLKAEKAGLEGRNSNCFEAYNDALEIGFNLSSMMKPQSGGFYMWDQDADLFCVVKDNQLIAGDTGYKMPTKNYKLWKFVDTISATDTYSQYLTSLDPIENVSVISGFDAGFNEQIKNINYSNSGSAQDVILRTLGGKLTVNDTLTASHQTHYGEIDKATVTTGMECFVTHGRIDYMSLVTGKAIADENGIIYLMKAESETAAAEERGGVIIIPQNVTNNDVKTTELPDGYNVTESGTTQPSDIAEKIAENGGLLGTGTAEDPFQIYDYDTMQAVSNFYETGFKYFKVNIELTDNGTIDCLNSWKPVKLNGSFDGANVEYVNTSDYLFERIGYNLKNDAIYLKDFDVTFDGKGCLCTNIATSGSITLTRVNVHGTIQADDRHHVGSYFSYGTANVNSNVGADYSLTFNECVSDATLIATIADAEVAGFIGHVYQGTGHHVDLNFDSASNFTGKVSCAKGTGKRFYCQDSGSTSIYVDTFPAANSALAGLQCTKLTVVKPVKEASGYTVAVAEKATRLVFSFAGQFTAFNQDGNPIANLSGITMTIKNIELTSFTAGSSFKVCDLVTSFELLNGQEEFNATLVNGKLTYTIPQEANYQTGWVRIHVKQFDSQNRVVATGTLTIAQREGNKLSELPAWTIL